MDTTIISVEHDNRRERKIFELEQLNGRLMSKIETLKITDSNQDRMLMHSQHDEKVFTEAFLKSEKQVKILTFELNESKEVAKHLNIILTDSQDTAKHLEYKLHECKADLGREEERCKYFHRELIKCNKSKPETNEKDTELLQKELYECNKYIKSLTEDYSKRFDDVCALKEQVAHLLKTIKDMRRDA